MWPCRINRTCRIPSGMLMERRKGEGKEVKAWRGERRGEIAGERDARPKAKQVGWDQTLRFVIFSPSCSAPFLNVVIYMLVNVMLI